MSSYGMPKLINFFASGQLIGDPGMLTLQQLNDNQPQQHKSESIHSGHFMVSQLDETECNNEEEQVIDDSENTCKYVVIDTVPTCIITSCEKETANECSNDMQLDSNERLCSYVKNSHQVIIDASLSKLFKCMTLAYDGKLTSPKWKTFKGLKLKLKDKIRLNNIIWRAWHIQYIICRKPPVCQFMSPTDCDSHKKPEAVVLEGKYWKRRFTTVTAEYQKWRLYFKEKSDVSLNEKVMCSRIIIVIN